MTPGLLRAMTILAGGLRAAAPPVDVPAGADPAQPDTLREYRLDPIVVWGDPLSEPAGTLPVASSRIGRGELARRPGATLADLLGTVAGVRVASRGLAAAGGAVSIRGSTTDQVVVLVDGRRVTQAQGGGADPATFSLDAVESVDVYRGGASALWGGDALGGAILVHSRRARPGLRARVAGGSFGERGASLDGGFLAGDDWSLRAGARLHSTDGDYSFEDDGRTTRIANGDVRRAGADGRLEGHLAGATASVDASFLDQERGLPGSAEFPTPTARLDGDRASAGFALRDASGGWRPALDLSWLRQTQRYREPGAAFGPVDDRHENTRARLEASVARTRGRSSAEAVAGIASDRLRSTTDGTRRRTAADARMQVSRDATVAARTWRLLGAARLDAVEGWAPVVSPRIGVTADVVPGFLRLSSSAGTAFRMPSFDELFWPPRASAAGNPRLEMERGRDVDLGATIDGLPAAGSLSFSAFARRVEDLIQWMPGADGVWRPHNVGEARLAGVETDARATLRRRGSDLVRVAASGTWLSTEDRSGEPNVDGKSLVYRPRWTGALSAIFPGVLGGELEGALRATDRVFVTRANTKSLAGYAVADLRWRRPLGDNLAVDVAISNLGDVSARDFRDYPLPARSLAVGLAWEGRPW